MTSSRSTIFYAYYGFRVVLKNCQWTTYVLRKWFEPRGNIPWLKKIAVDVVVWFIDGGLSTVKGKLKWYAGEKWFDIEGY